ncbi:MAG: spore coat protein U domain-containing protein [Terracidiphilus sp.]|jgi:spore coat protein U-like protein
MKRKLLAAGLLILSCGTLKAAAQTCTLTLGDLNFGTYTGTQLDVTSAKGQFNNIPDCTGSWQIPLNAGLGVGATETTRKMTSMGGAELNYEIFQDAARTTNWGGTGNDLTGNNYSVSIYAYGRILPNQNVAPGTYTDTISSATTSFTVTAFIQANCTISANNLSFGTYTGALINATTLLTVTCTNKTVFAIGLNAGTATGATVTTRAMTGPGSATLGYSLFRDSGRTLNWGNTVGTDTLQETATGSAVQYTVYGQIPAGTVPVPGTYTDTIIATVSY